MLTLIGHSVDGLVLGLGHVAEVGEDHKAREEAREAVDRRCDLEIIKKRFKRFCLSHHDISVAVVVELVVAGVGQVDAKACSSAVENLDGCVYPHLKSAKLGRSKYK